MTDKDTTNLIPGGGLLGYTIDITGKYVPSRQKEMLFADVGNDTWENNASQITYRLPDNFGVTEVRETHAEVHTFASFAEVSARLAAEAKLNIDGIPALEGIMTFGGEASAQFKAEFSSTIEFSYAWVDDRHKLWSLQLKNKSFDYLTANAQKALGNLPTEYNESNQAQFFKVFDQFGLFYVSNVDVGGKLYYSATVLQASSSGSVSVEEKLSAEFDAVKAISGSAEAKADWAIAGKSWVKNRSVVIDAIGGDTNLMNLASPEFGESYGTEFNKWVSTIERAPAPISYAIEPISSVVKPEAEAATRKAMDAYLNRNTIQIKTHAYPYDTTQIDLPTFRVQQKTLSNDPASPKPGGVRVALLTHDAATSLWDCSFDKYYFASNDHFADYYALSPEMSEQIASEVQAQPSFKEGTRVLLTYFNIWGVGPISDPGYGNTNWFDFLARCGAGKDTYHFMCSPGWACGSSLISSYSLFGVVGNPTRSVEVIKANDTWVTHDAVPLYVDRTIFIS